MWNFSPKKALFIYYVVFCIISKILFININDISGYIVDELFHIPQGLHYCNFNFSVWDPKITTLPGLYILSMASMAPLGLCSAYGMRLTNLLAGFLNVLLFIYLYHLEHDLYFYRRKLSWLAIISGINTGILPPLYFFSHFYYTDTISVTSILIMLICDSRGSYGFAGLAGIWAVLIRQTNIIWVVMLFGKSILYTFVDITVINKRRVKHSRQKNFTIIYECIRNVLKRQCKIRKISSYQYYSFFSYLTVMILFLIFIFINGSIVVGDKSAHEASIHIPQFFYFFLFTVIFAAPHFLLEILPFLKYVWKHKLLCASLISLFIIIVHYNTVVHPYLLADNRHYTFYVWNRIYGRYPVAKYILTGAYLFGMYATLKTIDAFRIFGFVLVFVPCTLLVLSLQKLLDVRYFLIPFILLRLKFKTTNVCVLALEFFMYLIINCLTFYVFFSKEIIWNDFEETQRIIW